MKNPIAKITEAVKGLGGLLCKIIEYMNKDNIVINAV